jgi:arsenate reductase-like glutaredoxin family protein
VKVKKSLVVAAAAATIGLAGIGGASAVLAQSSATSDSLIDKIAQKFNLNKDDVKSVFEEEHATRLAERQTAITERLDEAVKAGDITTAQETLIENKLKEIQASHESERQSLETWAKQNNIDTQYIAIGKMGMTSTGLQKLVDSGKITTDQQKLIEAKLAELNTKQGQARTALRQWAKDNNIDTKYLMFGPMRGGAGALR